MWRAKTLRPLPRSGRPGETSASPPGKSKCGTLNLRPVLSHLDSSPARRDQEEHKATEDSSLPPCSMFEAQDAATEVVASRSILSLCSLGYNPSFPDRGQGLSQERRL